MNSENGDGALNGIMIGRGALQKPYLLFINFLVGYLLKLRRIDYGIFHQKKDLIF